MSRLVRILASRIHATLPRDAGIELSDLIQAGNVGFLQATRTFSAQRGAPMSGYAKFRIRGEILDTVRRHSGRLSPHLAPRSSAVEDAPDLEELLPSRLEDSPHCLLSVRQGAAILGEEVARLPPRHRAVVRMRYSREYSLRQIGAVLRVHESRACQLHRSALRRLRRALSKRGLSDLSTLI
ncbi:MAG: sigma-70 family RNA polymerase sigma factor [Acidobacteriota bacterium]|nr:sigma-70 family RNA polymerase sigma factor [Acidobacteriota bacterium]